MRKKILTWVRYFIRYGLPMALSALLVVWLFRKVNFRQMMDLLHHGVNYWWILLMMVLTVFSHIIRGYRWGMQLSAAGINTPIGVRCVAVFGNYALNLLIPKIGEVWRPLYISRTAKAPFSKVLGTLLGDRTCDGLTVLCLIAMTFVLTSSDIRAFVHKYPVGRDILDVLDNPILWGCILGVFAIVWALFHFGSNLRFVKRTEGSLEKCWVGFKALAAMKKKGLFLVYTLGIWICYYLQVYVCFFAFPFTDELAHEPHMAFGLMPALVAFVFSTISMAIPSNGGLGPWNLAIIFGLTLFGVNRTDATAFSMLVWAAQSFTLVLLGIYSLVFIMGGKDQGKSSYTPSPEELKKEEALEQTPVANS